MSMYAKVYSNNVVKELTSELEDFFEGEILIEEAEGETKLFNHENQTITRSDLETEVDYFREFPLTDLQARKISEKLDEGKLVLLTAIKDAFDEHRYIYIMKYDTIIRDKSPSTLI